MAFLQVTNRAISKLTSDILSTDTSFTVTTGDGALFPTGNFIVTIENERILVGSRSNDTFSSLTRGYDGTTASSHTAGASVELRIVAKHIQELQAFCNTAGQANGLATLDANSKVVQNPASATSTPTANAIVMAGSDGKINDGWNVQSIATTASPTFAGLTVDTNTIYVDKTNHRLGIGTTTPAYQLTMNGVSAIVNIIRQNDNNTSAPGLLLDRSHSSLGNIVAGDTLGKVQFRGYVSGSPADYGMIAFIASDTSGNGRYSFTDSAYAEKVSIFNNGNVSIGGTATRATTAGQYVLNIFNGTAPVGTLTNGISNNSSGGNPYVMDSAGNAQPLGVSGTPKFAGIIYNPTSAPSSPVKGQVYFDSTANKLKVYNGSAWETVSSS